MARTARMVYFFGNGKADGRGDQKVLLGGKGAGLAEMTRIGLPVPCGFTITTDTCAQYNSKKGKWPSGFEKQVRQMISKMERSSGKKLGGVSNPLLVSVRSGAAVSMPGMMETILNLGLNDQSVEGLAKKSGNRRFAMDSYRRFIMMYGATAKGIDKDLFEELFDELKQNETRKRLGLTDGETVQDTDVDADELATLVDRFKAIYSKHTGESFPQDPFQQLRGAINAVFDSWMFDKAVTYRRVENITGLNGTAVNVCRMVYGNMGDDCATGVCFTRDPSTGEMVYYGDALINAQGEDVVAGIRTPISLAELKKAMPDVYAQLDAVRVILEVHYREMQDIEFTVERGKLYMLQCRTGKRSPGAAFKIAVDQATRGLMTTAAANRLVTKKHLPKRYASSATKPVISKDEAILRIGGVDVERLFYPVMDSSFSSDERSRRFLTQGIGAVPGAACGRIVFTAKDAENLVGEDYPVILLRKETSPEDVGGMHVAIGILTATGGKTSHAAVVARGWGKCCIVGCGNLIIDAAKKKLTIEGRDFGEGDWLTLDGSSGDVFEGQIPLVRPQAPREYETLMRWCDARRRLGVRANADTPVDAARAIELGAEGIGLCRTEHMFFDPSEPQRLTAMRQMILADSEPARRRALDRLLPYQRRDFEGIYEAMSGKPVTIRLLDPPLHEFLPQHDNPEAQQAVADDLNATHRDDNSSDGISDNGKSGRKMVTVEDIRRRVDQLHESNPMLGHRGCRLCITYPEILEMQVRAIIEAAVNCAQRGVKVLPEIMIPLSIDPKELSILVERTRTVADAILKKSGVGRKVKYLVGTMIETPRAALLARGMAESAEFFSFGTNDLTQMTMGLSRDDAGRFLPEYVDQDKSAIMADDPFQTLDVEGVGSLVRTAVQEGRSSRPAIKLGICGEHGGDPSSIYFCESVGLDYVSCSPLRVPVARLAAAQAVIRSTSNRTPRVIKTCSKPCSDLKPKRRTAKSTRRETSGKKTRTRAKS